MSLSTWFLRLRLRFLEAQRVTLLQWAEEYRQESFDLGRRAYYMDQFETPMAWGRVQNAANWAKYHQLRCLEELETVNTSITAIKKELK